MSPYCWGAVWNSIFGIAQSLSTSDMVLYKTYISVEALVGTPGDPYDFAVGGMYCLNRAMLNKARRWIG